MILPLATDSGCAAVSRPACQAWSQPQPADLPWPQVMALSEQHQAGRNIGAAYLCAAVRNDQLHTLFGPSAVRTQDGPRCVLSSTESLNWIDAEHGTIHAEIAIDTNPAHATPQHTRELAGRTIVREPDRDTPASSVDTGWVDLPGTGRSLRIELTRTWPTPGPQPTGQETPPDPKSADRAWEQLTLTLITRTSP